MLFVQRHNEQKQTEENHKKSLSLGLLAELWPVRRKGQLLRYITLIK